MRREGELLFDEIVKKDLSVLDFINADFLYVNGPLANLYGITDTVGNRLGKNFGKPGEKLQWDKFVRVTLPDDERHVIELRFGVDGEAQPLSVREIARRLGLTARRVQTLETRGLERLSLNREIQALRDAA